LIAAAFRPERIELPQAEADLDNGKVGELTAEELAEALACVQPRRSA
jgi:hypothetical protein